MPYVRDRMRLSKDRARERSNFYRDALAPGPGAAEVSFSTALDWLRAAAVYAKRRNYRDTAAAAAGQARRTEILAAAAESIQEHACRIDKEVPPSFRRQNRRPEFKAAYSCARSADERMEAARVWFMFIARQAGRLGGDPSGRAQVIDRECAAQLIEWAKEMDADDYGQ